MTQPSILILGGAGFIGRAVSERLAQSGAIVHVITPGEGSAGLAPTVHVHQARLDDVQLLRELLPTCQGVIHAASASTPGTTRGDPAGECTANLLPTLRFLEVLQNYASVSLVYLSSGGTVYGDVPSEKVDESTVLRPRSYHGAGKVACEAFLHAYASQLGRSVVALRPSNVYGPGQPARTGFGIVRRLLDCAAHGEPVEIWGDGSSVRDYLYVEDLLEVCVRAVANTPRRAGMNAYNVCRGEAHSIDNLCSIVERITGRTLERRYRPGRSLDVRHSALDGSRLRGDFGWEPTVGLAQGVARTWEWLQTQ
jgi:UDP-glucose 4-epimerase